jgi:transposase-like protein/IS1 family transposase
VNCHCCSGPTKRFGRFENKNRTVQRYRCLKCGKTFSDAQPLQGVTISNDKIVQIVRLFTEGVGVRATARLTGCHSHSVLNVLRTVGQKCEEFHDRTMRNLKVQALQIDELWSRVGISQKRTTPADTERGDQYTFLVLTTREKLIVSHHTGKRDYDNTDIFVADVAARISGRGQITTDGWAAYPDTIRGYMLGRLDLAVCQKNFAAPQTEVEAARRYSPAPFVGITITVKAGHPRRDLICTSHVERVNLSVRHFNKRFVRLGLGWSRKLENHRFAISLFVCAHNFCKVHSTLGCTPAVGMKLAKHTWTVEELIEKASCAEKSG